VMCVCIVNKRVVGCCSEQQTSSLVDSLFTGPERHIKPDLPLEHLNILMKSMEEWKDL